MVGCRPRGKVTVPSSKKRRGFPWVVPGGEGTGCGRYRVGKPTVDFRPVEGKSGIQRRTSPANHRIPQQVRRRIPAKRLSWREGGQLRLLCHPAGICFRSRPSVLPLEQTAQGPTKTPPYADAAATPARAAPPGTPPESSSARPAEARCSAATSPPRPPR